MSCSWYVLRNDVKVCIEDDGDEGNWYARSRWKNEGLCNDTGGPVL